MIISSRPRRTLSGTTKDRKVVIGHVIKQHDGMGELRGRRGPACLDGQVHALKVLTQCRSIDVLRQDVRWILGAGGLDQGKVLGLDTILNPEVRHSQMADLAQPPAPTDPDSSGSI